MGGGRKLRIEVGTSNLSQQIGRLGSQSASRTDKCIPSWSQKKNGSHPNGGKEEKTKKNT